MMNILAILFVGVANLILSCLVAQGISWVFNISPDGVVASVLERVLILYNALSIWTLLKMCSESDIMDN